MEYTIKFINFIKEISDTKSRVGFVISSGLFACYLFSPLQIIENLSSKSGIDKSWLFLGLFLVIYFTIDMIVTVTFKVFPKVLIGIKNLNKKIKDKRKDKNVEMFYKELICYANSSERRLLKEMFEAPKLKVLYL